IESLEGKRGTPRIRPPFPVVKGYLGRPTAVNNVETLAKTCLIALDGGAADCHARRSRADHSGGPHHSSPATGHRRCADRGTDTPAGAGGHHRGDRPGSGAAKRRGGLITPESSAGQRRPS
ncbi:MAG TPA: hypothetical protein PLI79_18155, partial [Mycobacterium sp.]|nr:hypothetical protein [Mycobacterium sp.]